MFPETRVCSICLLRKLHQNFFRAAQRLRKEWAEDQGSWDPHTLGIFPGDENRNSVSQGPDSFEKTALHLKGILVRPPIYDREYPEKLYTASPGTLVGITQPSLVLLFVQLKKKFCLRKSRQVFTKISFWEIPATNCGTFARSQNLHQNPLLSTLLYLFLSSSIMHHFAARWTCKTLDNAEFLLRTFSISGSFRPIFFWNTQNIQPKNDWN